MSKFRVIQWGTGWVGAASLRYVLQNRQLQLVGVKCHTAEKVGRTAGELAGLAPGGVTATNDPEKILRLSADCVLFMPRDAQADPSLEKSPSRQWVPDLIAVLASGKNVVCSIGNGTLWKHMAHGQGFHDELSGACQKGKSTLYFTGFDPGFITDALAFYLSSVVGNLNAIRSWEVIDYGDYPVESTLRQLGFGVTPNVAPDLEANYRAVWGGAIYLLADALGVSIDAIEIKREFYLTPTAYTAPGGMRLERGTIAAYQFSVIGIVGGCALININHVTRMGQQVAPDWPRIGRDGGYRVEIDGFPPFRAEMPMGLAGGTGSSFGDAMAMTAARCVNSIEAVIQARPGYLTFLDLPPIGGKYALAQLMSAA